jgi:tol-pal system protein YbgF
MNKTLLLLIFSSLLPCAALAARGEEDLEQRLERLESMLQNQGLLEMSQQLEQLQTEVQELRGTVERQANEVESLGKRQRDLYMDIDTRLNDLQLGGPPAGAPTGAVPVPPVPASSAVLPAEAAAPVGAAATTTAAAPAPAADAEQERREYMAAFEILREGRYAQAIEAFTVFIKKYPGGKYANNAQYWVGEAHYASRNLEQALVEFEKLIKDYPWSSKIPDAKLKMGYTLYELGQWQKSREVLINIMTTYPKSSFALLAEKRVQRLTQEGH